MTALSFQEVVDLVVAERSFQDWKHGTIDDNPHQIGGWLLLLEAELNEAKKAAIKGGTGRDSVMAEIIQIAALAMAAVEQYGVHEQRRLL